jgi:hypothetical protein
MVPTIMPQPDLDDRPGHTVGFYETDRFLLELVAGYVGPAIERDETAFAIMTEEHHRRLAAVLEAAGTDVDEARNQGRFVPIEANTTRRQLLVDGTLDPARFRSITDELFEHVAKRGRPVRIFGYMVALFWEDGNETAALALEDLWNDLMTERSFELLCAYPMRSFAGPDSDDAFRSVCDRHSGMANESYAHLVSVEKGGGHASPVVVLRRDEARVAQ